MKWLENTVKMCLLLTILRLERFVETGVRGLENELFFQDQSRNNFVVIFEFERFCENLKNGSIDFFKTLNTRARRCDQCYCFRGLLFIVVMEISIFTKCKPR